MDKVFLPPVAVWQNRRRVCWDWRSLCHGRTPKPTCLSTPWPRAAGGHPRSYRPFAAPPLRPQGRQQLQTAVAPEPGPAWPGDRGASKRGGLRRPAPYHIGSHWRRWCLLCFPQPHRQGGTLRASHVRGFDHLSPPLSTPSQGPARCPPAAALPAVRLCPKFFSSFFSENKKNGRLAACRFSLKFSLGSAKKQKAVLF